MRVLVCGSRGWTDHKTIKSRLEQLPKKTIIIHGGADGADSLAGHIASERLGMHVAIVRALWHIYDKGAGSKRNRAMLDLEPDLVIAFSLGTRGTRNMIKLAEQHGIEVEVVKPEKKR